MKLNTQRHKQAVCRGYQARFNNEPITKNYYSGMGKRYQTYASLWDKGWHKADENLNKGKEK